MKIYNFRGDVTDISAKKEGLLGILVMVVSSTDSIASRKLQYPYLPGYNI